MTTGPGVDAMSDASPPSILYQKSVCPCENRFLKTTPRGRVSTPWTNLPKMDFQQFVHSANLNQDENAWAAGRLLAFQIPSHARPAQSALSLPGLQVSPAARFFKSGPSTAVPVAAPSAGARTTHSRKAPRLAADTEPGRKPCEVIQRLCPGLLQR